MIQSSDVFMTTPDGAESADEAREIARGAGISAWRQIADEIEADIAAGRFAAGTQLPTEAQLATRFAVNRHTVRRGLAELAARGLVRATQGRGTFVEARPLPYPIGPRTRFSEIVSRAGREAGGRLLGSQVVAADPRTAAALGIVAGEAVIRLDTLRSADGSPISLGSGFFPLPRFERFGDAYLAYGSITGALASRGVADYRRFETRISARPAGAEEATHLDLAPGRLLLAVDSINVDSDGTPIQFTRALFAADRTEIVVES
ncbi:phosphonate metabolism transcriptional regulator PhnF [Mesorhizobium sp. BR1-1-16]|uniref:phosphonate metabolism transcriptional regulator PhnF n=1 Tax=Mesorhizobium sp. BR1-1-16 TaxID=2876653 RepID=UPI001CCCCE48|nr:phosphonate metabolism transcriptional regulator PhnF [Mesorhizobium sp. BR1-1-16]MBZ9936177.1 phosphonate metabolism transcriptional regulator PhnF [Mesorhizobium sp. BR1-1-16]